MEKLYKKIFKTKNSLIRKDRNNGNDIRCNTCYGVCVPIELSFEEMEEKLKKLVERNLSPFKINIEDFNRIDKIKQINSYVNIMLATYQYMKCPNCNWGFLRKYPVKEIAERLHGANKKLEEKKNEN